MSASAINHAAVPAGASPATQPEAFVRALATWFASERRDLPWRRDPSAYKTVVSELMLQQTQVVTALPYFERWVARWPDFASLAAASEADVLQMWEGLGYYSRARNLLKLAQAWVRAEQKPQTAAQWLEYPGVGPYTAAAIASIAFGEHAAVVDGNVVRILARLSADTTAYRNAALAVRTLTPLAQSVIAHAESPGLHNEAMMELGATLCRKGQPQCLLCPVRGFCLGQQLGNELVELPRIARKQVENRVVARAFVFDAAHQRVLLFRYGAASRRLAGLCELPLWEAVAEEGQSAKTQEISGGGLHGTETVPASTAPQAAPRKCAEGTGFASAPLKSTRQKSRAGVGAKPADICLNVMDSAAAGGGLPFAPQGSPLMVKSRGIANERIEERFYAWPQSGNSSEDAASAADVFARLADIPETVPAQGEGGLFWQPIASLHAVTLTGPHRRWLALLLKACR